MTENNISKSKALSEIQKVLSLAEEKKFAAGDVIFEEGGADENFYIILRGSIEISKKTTDGQSKAIAQIGVGEFLGEGALSGVTIKPATATAIEDATLLTLSHDHFEKLATENPKDAIAFLISVLEAVNTRLGKTNTKLLALFEMNQIMNMHRDDLNILAKELVEKLSAILEAKEGILLVKNPFAKTYRSIFTSSKELEEYVVNNFDVEKAQMISDDRGHFLIANLKELGAIIIRRDADHTPFESDQLRLLILIAEQAAYVIKEASEKASEKARELLHQKRFDI